MGRGGRREAACGIDDETAPTRAPRGDLLADGIVTHVSPLGLFASVSLDQTFQGTKKRLVLRILPPQPPAPISVSHETTRITSPLMSDGTPDYGAWLNAEHGAGVTEENNAAPLVQAALGQLVDPRPRRLRERERRAQAMSAHVVLEAGTPGDRVLQDLHVILHARFGIDHTTIQIETETPTLVQITPAAPPP